MAEITVQEVPRLTDASITFQAPTASGDFYSATGNEIVLVQFGATALTEAVEVRVEGVPANDSGRDGYRALTAIADGGSFKGAGPFRNLNYRNASGGVELTYWQDVDTTAAPATGLAHIIRVERLSKNLIVGLGAGPELGGVGFSNRDGAGPFQTFHN